MATNISAPPVFKQPSTLAELLAIRPADLDNVDVALINILCAEGLPGTEELSVQKSLDTLDVWAKIVKLETTRNLHQYTERPELFCHSIAYYRMQMLGDSLVHDLGMRYNPIRAEESRKGLDTPEAVSKFFHNSEDIFLFGLLNGNHYGTCASMPFLYLAIGRRLGYPVNLVAAPEHLYVRYEDTDGDHLNVEATTVSRFQTPPDEFYRDMVTATNRDDAISQAGWLRPLSNREILGHSLLSRLACLGSSERYDEELKYWDIVAKYLANTPGWRKNIRVRKDEAQSKQDVAERTTLWRQISGALIPLGREYVHFREQKIRLHLLIVTGADLATIKTATDAFNKDMGPYFKSEVERGSSPDLTLSSTQSSQPTGVSRFKFPESGKEIIIADNIMPPTARGGITAGAVKAIQNRHLKSAEAIVNFLWDNYEEAFLEQQRKVSAQADHLISGGPQPILVPRESVPGEYWNGLPHQLALMLDGETDPQKIVAIISTYHPSQQEHQTGQGNEAREPNLPFLEGRIRFVPGSTMPGPPLPIAPAYPNLSDSLSPQETLQSLLPQKGIP